MKLFFLCALSLIIFSPEFLLEKFTTSALFMQTLCQESVDFFDKDSPTRAALLCGTPIESLSTKKVLQDTGLIHLFIISGSHVVFIFTLLEQIKTPRRWIFLGLFMLTLFTGFQPPVVRAVIQFYLKHYQRRHRLHWKSDTTIGVTTGVCLLLFPSWWNSLSFHLSWMAALAFTIPIARNTPLIHKILLQQLLLFILLSPLLLTFSNAPLISIPLNITVGHALGPLLIPIALTPLWDPLMNALAFTLEIISFHHLSIPALHHQWCFLISSLFLQISLHYYRTRFWRKRCDIQ